MGFQAHSELPRRESNCILPLSFGQSSLQPQSTIYRSLHYWVEPVGCYRGGCYTSEGVEGNGVDSSRVIWRPWLEDPGQSAVSGYH